MKDIDKLIIYEDSDICVCHKPAGVLSQADRGLSEDLASALMTHERRNGVKMPFIAPINRLDRPVEGLVLYAKSSKTAAVLTKQLTTGEVDKCYYAVVEGIGETQETITLTDYIAKDASCNMSAVVNSDAANAKKAVLEYRALGSTDERTLLEVKLHTGRHHQIRVQLSHAGLPIV
ncbi:MAG: RluA family pseudouridine synthase, partial [Lachnospiraceae bacterium]